MVIQLKLVEYFEGILMFTDEPEPPQLIPKPDKLKIYDSSDTKPFEY